MLEEGNENLLNYNSFFRVGIEPTTSRYSHTRAPAPRRPLIPINIIGAYLIFIAILWLIDANNYYDTCEESIFLAFF